MYIEPTWMELFINGTILHVLGSILVIIVSFILSTTIIRIYDNSRTDKLEDNDRNFLRNILTVAIVVLLIIPTVVAMDYTWHLWMEEPSVRTDTITISGIQPLPGAVTINENGYYIDNSNQLMFVTTEGREFANTENWMFNKFETRTIFNKLRVNGTYKIKYYGWRNGKNNEFPNILSIEEIINENNTTPNDYNKYFGANRGNRAYDLEIGET